MKESLFSFVLLLMTTSIAFSSDPYSTSYSCKTIGQSKTGIPQVDLLVLPDAAYPWMGGMRIGPDHQGWHAAQQGSWDNSRESIINTVKDLRSACPAQKDIFENIPDGRTYFVLDSFNEGFLVYPNGKESFSLRVRPYSRIKCDFMECEVIDNL